jgi:MFS transporter, UMF1 family
VTAPQPSTGGPAVDARSYHRRIRAWSFYDWANHGYITSTATTLFPPFFVALAAPAFARAGGSSPAGAALARDTASNIFALTVSLALTIAALVAPLLGTFADITGRRKRLLVLTTVVGATAASAMVVLTPGRWLLALALYLVTQVAVNVALGLNSSLLPHLATPSDLNRASSLGYAMGYVGGGVLLAIHAAIFALGPQLGIEQGTVVRIAFFSVGLWWLAFTLPLLRGVPEPLATPLARGSSGSAVADTLVRLVDTVRGIRRHRELFKMLVAFWFYMEGVGAIILLATSYGAALGLSTGVLILTLLMTQFVAYPYALVFGRIPDPDNPRRAAGLALLLWSAISLPALGFYVSRSPDFALPQLFAWLLGSQALGVVLALVFGRTLMSALALRLDTKRSIILGLGIYAMVPVWGFLLHTRAEFLLLGWLVGTVQGGTQALSRSLYSRLSPRSKSGEFFGLYGLAEKFAGILGPLLYGLVGQRTHDPRASILSIVLFFILGAILLTRVDVATGEALARAEEDGAVAARGTG